MMSTATKTKQPSESKKYAIDFVDLLATGDSLASITSVTGTPTGLTITGPAIVGTTVTFMVAGGADGTTYAIEAIAVTTGGETLEGDGYLIVADIPTDAAESLRLVYSELLADLGDWMGWGRSGWDSDQTARLESIVKAGVARFYWPPPLQDGSPAHSWSFLKPATTIATVADQEDYDLPSDFGGLVGDLHFSAGDDRWIAVKERGPGVIFASRQRDLSSGTPQLFAILPQSSAGTAAQKWTLALVPPPDAIYTLHYRYQVVQTGVGDARPYHLGPAVHSQTLLQSCLAVAESRYRDGESQQQLAFLQQALPASIAYDRRMGPQTFGYNGDNSGQSPVRRKRGDVTYNGVLYDNT